MLPQARVLFRYQGDICLNDKCVKWPGLCRLCRGLGHPGAGPGGQELRPGEFLSSSGPCSESPFPQLEGGATAWIKTSDGVCGAPFQGHGEGLPFARVFVVLLF